MTRGTMGGAVPGETALTRKESGSIMHSQQTHPVIARIFRGIVALVMATALIVGVTSIMGCQSTKADYATEVSAALAEFEKVSAAYVAEQREMLMDRDPETPLTEEEIAAIKDMTDRFERDGAAALDKVLALDPPAEAKKHAEAMNDYVEFARDEILPTLTGGLRGLEAGETLNDFQDSTLDESLIGKARQLQGGYLSAIEELGISETASETPAPAE